MIKTAAWILALATTASIARADAMLTGGDGNRFPSRVDIDITVRAQIESTTIVLELSPLAVAGTYQLTVPAPAGATPIGVDLERGAGWVALPVIAGAPPAAGGGGSDPALSAWSGTAPLVAVLSELEPGPLTARVRFVRVLRRLGGQVAFTVGARRCPARDPADPGAATTVRLHLETARDLVRFVASGATVTQGVRGGELATDVTSGDAIVDVEYAEVSQGIGTQLVVHRTPTADPMGGDAGYFMLLVDADPAPSTMPRTLSLVVDHSGSMAGDKIVQARDAARAMLDHLRPTDDFTIHIFDNEIDSFRELPVPATSENIAAARTFIKTIEADGSTNLDGGLQAALTPPPRTDRFDAAIMLSDGLATSGETNSSKILANAWRSAGGDTRIFTFSVGSDADFSLMEALARGSRGRHVDLNNAQAASDLVIRSRELFEDIRDVRLTDLSLAVDGIGIADTLPESPPDLFGGGQIMIAARYTTPGAGEIRISGYEGELPFERTFVVDAPALAETADIVKYVWASEKVRALMAQIAAGGDRAQIRAEIEAIGVAYRIQTPFTSYSGTYDTAADDAATCSAGGGGAGLWVIALALVFVRRRRVC
jgi:MYXO-CTERM domain-containing protein